MAVPLKTTTSATTTTPTERTKLRKSKRKELWKAKQKALKENQTVTEPSTAVTSTSPSIAQITAAVTETSSPEIAASLSTDLASSTSIVTTAQITTSAILITTKPSRLTTPTIFSTPSASQPTSTNVTYRKPTTASRSQLSSDITTLIPIVQNGSPPKSNSISNSGSETLTTTQTNRIQANEKIMSFFNIPIVPTNLPTSKSATSILPRTTTTSNNITVAQSEITVLEFTTSALMLTSSGDSTTSTATNTNFKLMADEVVVIEELLDETYTGTGFTTKWYDGAGSGDHDFDDHHTVSGTVFDDDIFERFPDILDEFPDIFGSPVIQEKATTVKMATSKATTDLPITVSVLEVLSVYPKSTAIPILTIPATTKPATVTPIATTPATTTRTTTKPTTQTIPAILSDSTVPVSVLTNNTTTTVINININSITETSSFRSSPTTNVTPTTIIQTRSSSTTTIIPTITTTTKQPVVTTVQIIPITTLKTTTTQTAAKKINLSANQPSFRDILRNRNQQQWGNLPTISTAPQTTTTTRKEGIQIEANGYDLMDHLPGDKHDVHHHQEVHGLTEIISNDIKEPS